MNSEEVSCFAVVRSVAAVSVSVNGASRDVPTFVTDRRVAVGVNVVAPSGPEDGDLSSINGGGFLEGFDVVGDAVDAGFLLVVDVLSEELLIGQGSKVEDPLLKK